MSNTIGSSVAGMQLFVDAEGAASILQAAQFEYTEALQASFKLKRELVQDATQRLHRSLFAHMRLNELFPSFETGPNEVVLGKNLTQSNQMLDELTALGLAVDAPVKYPAIKTTNGQSEFVWLSPEERQNLQLQLELEESLNFNPQAWENLTRIDPRLKALTDGGSVRITRGTLPVPPEGDRVEYLFLDSKATRPVTREAIQGWVNQTLYAAATALDDLAGAKRATRNDASEFERAVKLAAETMPAVQREAEVRRLHEQLRQTQAARHDELREFRRLYPEHRPYGPITERHPELRPQRVAGAGQPEPRVSAAAAERPAEPRVAAAGAPRPAEPRDTAGAVERRSESQAPKPAAERPAEPRVTTGAIERRPEPRITTGAIERQPEPRVTTGAVERQPEPRVTAGAVERQSEPRAPRPSAERPPEAPEPRVTAANVERQSAPRPGEPAAPAAPAAPPSPLQNQPLEK